MEQSYATLYTAEGRVVYVPQNILTSYCQFGPVVVSPLVYAQMTQSAPMYNFPDQVSVVETQIEVQEPVMQEPVVTVTNTEVFEISTEVVEVIEPLVTSNEMVMQFMEEPVVQEVEPVVQEVEPVQREASPASYLQVIHEDCESISSAVTRHSESDSGYSVAAIRDIQPKQYTDYAETVTRGLPVYVAKVPMRVRSGCTQRAEMIDRIEPKTRVYLLEKGIENFPMRMVCNWWRNAIESLNSVIELIQYHNIDGREMADFSESTQQKLQLTEWEIPEVKKALALVSRKAQILYKRNGMFVRGWVSRIKKKQAQMSQIFSKAKPAIFVARLNNDGMTARKCEDKMCRTMKQLGLTYRNVRLTSHFERDPKGKDCVTRNGYCRYGNWKANNHCLIEFSTHQEAAKALQKLRSFSAYPEDFDSKKGYALYGRSKVVAYAKEYANLKTVTYRRF